MANPFENADGTYLVLVNEEGQYSLWPGFIDVPSGWTVVHEQKGREASLFGLYPIALERYEAKQPKDC